MDFKLRLVWFLFYFICANIKQDFLFQMLLTTNDYVIIKRNSDSKSQRKIIRCENVQATF